ncbi:uncharacterized protein LOC122093871 [Macadamia integrifolia]|uniref:uncharacterized protein LOC122093871 n=1 Tax=Macadamia integrifolia TaxID=60698 RepID=UPI001C531947|nr:uncharacterized protein LOC122093871 [Macadamia integrifolia]
MTTKSNYILGDYFIKALGNLINFRKYNQFRRDLLTIWHEAIYGIKINIGLIQKQAITVSCNVLIDEAELIRVCQLEIHGKFDISNLLPRVMYEVAFVVKLKEASNGRDVPINFKLILPDGTKQEHKKLLISKPKGQWMELLVGEFWTCQDMDGDLQFNLFGYKDAHWKSGLVIKGVIIRAKSGCNNELCYNHCTLIKKDLSITWGDDQRYWCWYCLNEQGKQLDAYSFFLTRDELFVLLIIFIFVQCDIFVELTELLNVCWLEVKGNFNISKLPPEIVYEVAFVVMLKDRSYGWEVLVTLRLVLPDGKMQERKEFLEYKPKGQWVELKLGEFKKYLGNAGIMQFSLTETQTTRHWKKGLVIKSVVIWPKN